VGSERTTQTTSSRRGSTVFNGSTTTTASGQLYVQGVQALVPEAFDGRTGRPVDYQSDLYVVANQFGSQFDKNEFQVLGTQFEALELPPEVDLRLANISLIRSAAYLYEAENGLSSAQLASSSTAASWLRQLVPTVQFR